MSAAPAHVRIVEVGPRDGLQNEPTPVSVATRIALIDALIAAGLRDIEAGSFVSPTRVPQMANTEAVLAGVHAPADVTITVLVPNMQGFASAKAAGARSIAVFASASETFSQRNINCSIDQSLDRFAPVLAAAGEANIAVRGYVSCVLGCPYEGEIAAASVARVAERLLHLGCTGISLGDTIGTGTPATTHALLAHLTQTIPVERLALHCHDTHGRALANVRTGLDCGVAVFDSSVAGLGGCPYAPGATGNVATEAVVTLLHGLGIDTGVDLALLAGAARIATEALAR